MVSGTHLHPQHHREGRRAGSRREATHLLGTGRGRRRVGLTGEGGARREGGAAGRSSQPLLLHRAAAGPGKRGAWRPSRGPPSPANTLPSSSPVAGGREGGCGGRSAGPRRTAAEGEEGSQLQRKREEVWARPKMRWPGEEEWPGRRRRRRARDGRRRARRRRVGTEGRQGWLGGMGKQGQ
jgi:hypothetical protein